MPTIFTCSNNGIQFSLWHVISFSSKKELSNVSYISYIVVVRKFTRLSKNFGDIYSRNSEWFALEFLENLEEILPGYWHIADSDSESWTNVCMNIMYYIVTTITLQRAKSFVFHLNFLCFLFDIRIKCKSEACVTELQESLTLLSLDCVFEHVSSFSLVNFP